MSKNNNFENELLLHIFNNTAIADVGDVTGLPAGTEGSLYVGLHTTAFAGDAAVGQDDNETAYTGYSRVALARTSGVTGWDVVANSCSPGADIDFGECSGAPGGALTHFTVGKEAGTGATKILYWGTLTPNITMATGVIPRIKTTSTITED